MSRWCGRISAAPLPPFHWSILIIIIIINFSLLSCVCVHAKVRLCVQQVQCPIQIAPTFIFLLFLFCLLFLPFFSLSLSLFAQQRWQRANVMMSNAVAVSVHTAVPPLIWPNHILLLALVASFMTARRAVSHWVSFSFSCSQSVSFVSSTTSNS